MKNRGFTGAISSVGPIKCRMRFGNPMTNNPTPCRAFVRGRRTVQLWTASAGAFELRKFFGKANLSKWQKLNAKSAALKSRITCRSGARHAGRRFAAWIARTGTTVITAWQPIEMPHAAAGHVGSRIEGRTCNSGESRRKFRRTTKYLRSRFSYAGRPAMGTSCTQYEF